MAEHAPHDPLTQARPGICPSKLGLLQSSNVEQPRHTPPAQAWPFAQSAIVSQTPHVPPTQPWPGWQSFAVEQVHDPILHFALGPHWLSAAHGPQTPAGGPPSISSARPPSDALPQTPPELQSLFELHAAAQRPETQASPEAQSLLIEHVHSNFVCVGVHCALGPHWLFEVQFVQVPPLQICPGSQLLGVQDPPQPDPVHGWHTI